MNELHKGIAVGGPLAGQLLTSETLLYKHPQNDVTGRFFSYATYSLCTALGVNFWVPTGIAVEKALEIALDGYGQWATMVRSWSNAKLEVGTNDSDLSGMRGQLDDISKICMIAGIDSRKPTVKMVQDLAQALKLSQQAYRTASEMGQVIIAAVQEKLRSAGHKHEGHALPDLIDMAIDTERTRHHDSLVEIAKAIGIAFCVGSSHKEMRDCIVNYIQNALAPKLQAPRGRWAGGGASGGGSGAVAGGGGSGGMPTVASTGPTLEERVAALERKVGAVIAKR